VKICVGSKNPSKIRGVEKAFKLLVGDVNTLGFDVKGLIPQPIGLDQIINSAKYRVEKVKELDPECDFYVGIEAGLIELREGRFFDVHVAYIVDREGNVYYGLSPAFEIPRRFVEKILSGEYRELEEIVDSYFGTKNIGETGGFISLLTRKRIIREELIYYSVTTALIPFLNKWLYKNDSLKK